MEALKVKIRPLSPFGTFPRGDVLFGHFLYWGGLIYGKQFLILFGDYLTTETPPVIFSDFLPAGYLPKPQLPLELLGIDEDRKKEFRKIRYISIADLQALKRGNPDITDPERFEKLVEWDLRTRNSINRVTGTTGEEPFNPYQIGLTWFKTYVDLYILFDPERFKELKPRANFEVKIAGTPTPDRKEGIKGILDILVQIGQSGFGRRSSIGLGQFEVVEAEYTPNFQQLFQLPEERGKKYFLEEIPAEVLEEGRKLKRELRQKFQTNQSQTSHPQSDQLVEVPLHLGLAAVGCGNRPEWKKVEGKKNKICVPGPRGEWCKTLFRPFTFYSPVTKFGRHHNTKTPFKAPVILAQIGGVYAFKDPDYSLEQLIEAVETRRELPLSTRDQFGGGICNSINRAHCCTKSVEFNRQKSLLQGFAPLVQFRLGVPVGKLTKWLTDGSREKKEA